MLYSILPFRVWNHLFMCNRSQHKSNMCKLCTKIYIKKKKLSGSMNEKLFEQKDDHFPVQFRYGIMPAKNLNLFVRNF